MEFDVLLPQHRVEGRGEGWRTWLKAALLSI